MTINQLRQYRKLKGRKLLLEAERDEIILRAKAADGTGTRSGASASVVERASEDREQKQDEIDKLKERLKGMEDYIDGCDKYIGTMLRRHYIEGKSWTAIAMIQGGNNTKESVRKMCHRYVAKNP